MSDSTGPRLVIDYGDLPPEDSRRPRRDPMAVASAVLGLTSVLFAGVALGPPAVVTGILALRRARWRWEFGGARGLAWTGLISGLLGTLLWTGVIIWAVRRPKPEPAVLFFPEGQLDPDTLERTPSPFKEPLLAHVSLVLEVQEDQGWRAVSAGSGVALLSGPEGIGILTCRHVVRHEGTTGATRLKASWYGGGSGNVEVLWTSSPDGDMALLWCPSPIGSGRPGVVPPGAPGELGVGDDLFAVGDPLSYRTSLARGTLSAMRIQSEGPITLRTLQVQIPLNPGNSGGGLYDHRGRLVGISSRTIAKDRGEGMGFGLSISNLEAMAPGMPSRASALVTSWLKGEQNPPTPPRPTRRTHGTS